MTKDDKDDDDHDKFDDKQQIYLNFFPKIWLNIIKALRGIYNRTAMISLIIFKGIKIKAMFDFFLPTKICF